VIPFPVPPHWSFFDYVEGGINRIEEWYQELSQEGKDTFDTLLKNTSKIGNHLDWGGFKYLKGSRKKNASGNWISRQTRDNTDYLACSDQSGNKRF
jgi:hypothetical protein